MTCDEFEDRLYDEDTRVALLGRGLAPADVAAHGAHCPGCRASWAQASAEAHRLVGVMIVAPPPALHATLWRAFRSTRRNRTPWVDVHALSWVVTGGALGAGFAASVVPPTTASQWTGFWVGAACGLVSTALPSMRVIWRAPWALMRAVLAPSR